jgi:ribonuclease P protein component
MHPTVVHGTYVTVIWAVRPDIKAAKAAVVVSKKVSNRAVERNKVQRRLREILRPIVAAAKSVMIVVRAKKGALEATMPVLRADLEPLLARMAQQLSGQSDRRYNTKT